MSSGTARSYQSKSLNRVLLVPAACLLIAVPAALGIIYFLNRNALEYADERYVGSAARYSADLISLSYSEVARHYTRMIPAAERSHRELNRTLPDTLEEVDVRALRDIVRARIPEGIHVDVAAVSQSLVILDTTYLPEKGLDLSAFSDAVADFEEARKPNAVSVAFPVVESAGKHVRLYSHMLAPSGRYFTQLAFYSSDADRLFEAMRERLSERGDLRCADVFLVSHDGGEPLPHVFHFNQRESTCPESVEVRDAIDQLINSDEDSAVHWLPDQARIDYYQKVALDPGLVGTLPFGAVVCVQLDTHEHLRALAVYRVLVLAAIFFVLGAIALVGIVLRRAVQRPLQELAQHIDKRQRLRDGGAIYRTHELSLIAERFNEHLSSIQRGEDEMRALYADAEERVRGRTEDLRRLSRRLLSAQEDEMRRISMELHDGFGQSLVGLRLKLRGLSESISKGDARRSASVLAECENVLDQALSEVRHLIDILRPAVLGANGLAGALQWLGGQYGDLMAVNVIVKGEGPERLDEQVSVAAYRIAQEAISNAMKHSGARAVDVTLQTEPGGALTLIIQDEGEGFRPGDVRENDEVIHHYGLESMKERARLSGATLDIISSPGKGTRIEACWPLDAGKN